MFQKEEFQFFTYFEIKEILNNPTSKNSGKWGATYIQENFNILSWIQNETYDGVNSSILWGSEDIVLSSFEVYIF